MRPTAIPLALVGIALLVGSACEAPDRVTSPGALVHQVDTVAGVAHVRNSGQPPNWQLRELVTVGSQGSAGEARPDEFGRIASVAPDSAGNLWIADVMNHEISAFGGDGTLLRRFGREGQGPGEFIQLYSIAWVGGRLLALDLGNGRVSELSGAGDVLGSRPAPGRVSGSPAMLRLYPLSDHRVYQWSMGEIDGRPTRTWVEHGPDGITGEWPQHQVESPAPVTIRCDRPDGLISFFEVPFAGRVLQHPAGSGRSYVAWSAEYRIALLSPGGDTLRAVERDHRSVPIRDDEWDMATAEFTEFQREWPGAPCEPSRMIRPESKAAMNNLLVDTEDRLWVEVFTDGGTAWEVFNSDGRLQGRIPGFDYDDRVAPSISGELLAWVDRDSLGIQRAHLARIVVAPGSLGAGDVVRDSIAARS